jgi:hypothetical protein
MEPTKPKLFGWLCGIFIVGILIGIGLSSYFSRDSAGNFIAIHDIDRLKMSALVLKMLDENKADTAIQILEENIKAVLETAPKTLESPMNEQIREALKQDIQIAERAMKDRNKPHLQPNRDQK